MKTYGRERCVKCGKGYKITREHIKMALANDFTDSFPNAIMTLTCPMCHKTTQYEGEFRERLEDDIDSEFLVEPTAEDYLHFK